MSGRPALDLGGTFLPVTSPFSAATGDLDLPAFRSNLRHWFEHPVAGVLIAGTTGESALLEPAERVALVRTAVETLPEGRLVIAGTGAESTRHTIELGRQAAEAGVGAVLVQPPAFFRGAMTPAVLDRHYRAVADASPVPVLVYQPPLRVATIELPTEVVADLSGHPNVIGIKDSRGELALVAELVEQTADGFQVLVGSGGLLYAALEIGAVGGIVGVGLMATAGAAEVTAAFLEGRLAEARAAQERIAPVHQAIVAGRGVPGVKAALDLLGLNGGEPRPPLAPAPEAVRREVRSVLESANLLSVAGV